MSKLKKTTTNLSAYGQNPTTRLRVIPIKTSSLYLFEVYCINLVRWILRTQILQTNMRLRTEDQMATQTGQRNREQSPDIKRGERRAFDSLKGRK